MYRYWLSCLILAISLTACGDDSDASSTGPDDPGRITTLESSLRRASPSVPAGDLEALVTGNTAFALDLYEALRAGSDDNLFFSPHSICLALVMTWAGARGETAEEMAEVLRVALPAERLHPAYNALDQALGSRGQRVRDDGEGSAFQLSVANSTWGQEGFDFEADYLDLLAEHYGAGMRLVDFIGAPERARGLINAWVEEQTEERIQDLLPEGSVNGLTRLVLTNAIYFKASWLEPFDAGQTRDGRFTSLAGRRVTVPMMQQSIRTGYAEGADYQAVELPYVGHEVSMVVIVPAAGRFEAFEEGLDAGRLTGVVDGLGDAMVELTMPRFEFEAEAGLSEVLKGMGMVRAFTPPSSAAGADLSGMNGQRDLFIHDVLHKAFVAVDEEGTEAAAATAVVVGVESAPMPATLVVDRPFVFVIRDRETGAVLFVGRVVDPS